MWHAASMSVHAAPGALRARSGLELCWTFADIPVARPERIVVVALTEHQAPTGNARRARAWHCPLDVTQGARAAHRGRTAVVRRDAAPDLLDPLLAEWLRRR